MPVQSHRPGSTGWRFPERAPAYLREVHPSPLPQLHGHAAGLFAALGGVHEGEHFECVFIGERGFFGFEKLHDLEQQRPVAIHRFGIALVHPFVGPEHHGAKFSGRPKRTHRAQPAVFPLTHDDVGVRRGDTRDLFAAASHQGVEQLDGVNRVPGKIELMVRLDGSRLPRHRARDIGEFQPRGRFGKPQIGSAKPGHARLFGQTCDLARVLERGGERFIDVHGFMRRDHRLHLLEMYAAIHAFEQDAIHFAAQRRNIGDHLDLPFGPQLFGELVYALVAGFDVRTATLVGRDNARAGDVVGRAWVVENLGERDDVRSISADDAQTYHGPGAHGREDQYNEAGFHFGHCTLNSPVDLSTPLTYVKGVGPARAAMLETKGLLTVEDLLVYVPFRYEDRSNMKTIAQLAPGEMATVVAEVRTARVAGFRRRNLGLFEVSFTDASG